MINLPGGPEMMVILLVALLVLGPQQLPKAMRTLGSVMAEIRKVSSGFQNEMRSAMDSITDDTPLARNPSTRPASATTSATTAPVATSGTEVVARNPEPATSGAEAGAGSVASALVDAPSPAGPIADEDAPVAAPSPIDAVDRAAG